VFSRSCKSSLSFWFTAYRVIFLLCRVLFLLPCNLSFPQSTLNNLRIQLERDLLTSLVDSSTSHSSYRLNAQRIIHSKRQSLYALPSEHWQQLAAPPISILETFSRIEEAINKNALFSQQILQAGLSGFGLLQQVHSMTEKDDSLDWRGKATPLDNSKASTTIRQVFRDWSSAGRFERSACFVPVMASIVRSFPTDIPREKIHILVPGAGLGRLVFDLCAAGYTVEGNEISYHALLASSFMLNHCTQAEEYEVFPWALGFSNNVRRQDQLDSVKVPDVHPARVMAERAAQGSKGSMSISSADFCVEYAAEDAKDSFDVVATVFFIDTAPDFLRYLAAVKNCLRKGGIWTNIGPLLWHFENGNAGSGKKGKGPDEAEKGIGEAGSVELTDEEVVELVRRSGFILKHHISNHPTSDRGYIQRPNSMLQTMYRPSHWVARKE
jgi:carnosine N-methyltransferase